MIGRVEYRFDALLWLYPGDAGWHFVTLPAELSDELREIAGPRRGFGSVRVRATIGATAWDTSIFPDRETGSYLLPVKQQVRRSEGLRAGSLVAVRLGIVGRRAT